MRIFLSNARRNSMSSDNPDPDSRTAALDSVQATGNIVPGTIELYLDDGTREIVTSTQD
jgi:hypothetical protein